MTDNNKAFSFMDMTVVVAISLVLGLGGMYLGGDHKFWLNPATAAAEEVPVVSSIDPPIDVLTKNNPSDPIVMTGASMSQDCLLQINLTNYTNQVMPIIILSNLSKTPASAPPRQTLRIQFLHSVTKASIQYLLNTVPFMPDYVAPPEVFNCEGTPKISGPLPSDIVSFSYTPLD